MTSDTFPVLFLIGRAGSGKSEFIDYIKQVPDADRQGLFHIDRFDEVDDFPILYSMFQDEDLWEKLGRTRTLAHKREHVYVTLDYDLYQFLNHKLNRIVGRYLSDESGYGAGRTLFVEFARGREKAYEWAFEAFDDAILKRSAIIYLDNTFEESMRRNTIRATDSDSQQTILKHRTPVEVMEYYYQTHDWEAVSGGKEKGHLIVRGVRVPFVKIWNMPETHDFAAMEARYRPALVELWKAYENNFLQTEQAQKII